MDRGKEKAGPEKMQAVKERCVMGARPLFSDPVQGRRKSNRVHRFNAFRGPEKYTDRSKARTGRRHNVGRFGARPEQPGTR